MTIFLSGTLVSIFPEGVLTYCFIYLPLQWKALTSGWSILFIGSMFISSALWLTWNELKSSAINLMNINKDLEKAFLRQQREYAEKFTEVQLARINIEYAIGNVGHEIRNPLHALMGMADLMARQSDTCEVGNFISIIQNCTQSLLKIVEDLTDVDALEQGAQQSEAVPVSLQNCLSPLFYLMKPKASAKGLNLTLDISPEISEYIYGDATRLWQIFFNLIDNAIKFTHEGSVQLQVRRRENFLTFSVEDTGTGISEQDQDLLFEKYHNFHKSEQKKSGQRGRGLNITRELVELLSGTLWVESEQGFGSTFFVEIPLIPFDPNGFLPDPASVEKLCELGAQLKEIRVLIVEDDPFEQMLAKDDLNYFIPNVNVQIAKNGWEAIGQVQEKDFDLILMDLQLPKVNGYETTLAIRSIEVEAGKEHIVPIIALTGEIKPAILARCCDAGMTNVISKPYRVDELIHVIYEEITNPN